VPGDDPHLGRNRAILQGMSMDDADARVELDPPAALLSDPAEGHLLVVEEEILVHPAHLSDQGGIHQHARAGHPVDGARPDVPGGLILTPRTRDELLADRLAQAGEGAYRALGRAIRIEQSEPDDPGRTDVFGLVVVEPSEGLSQESGLDLDVRV